MTRREWSNLLCRRLTEKIAEEVPKGLGRWPGAWKYVDPPSNEFMEILADWEKTGALEDKKAAVLSAEEVFQAWKGAALRWEQAGRPTAEVDQHAEATA